MPLQISSRTLHQLLPSLSSLRCLLAVHLSTRRLHLSIFLRQNKIPVSFLIRNNLTLKDANANIDCHAISSVHSVPYGVNMLSDNRALARDAMFYRTSAKDKFTCNEKCSSSSNCGKFWSKDDNDGSLMPSNHSIPKDESNPGTKYKQKHNIKRQQKHQHNCNLHKTSRQELGIFSSATSIGTGTALGEYFSLVSSALHTTSRVKFHTSTRNSGPSISIPATADSGIREEVSQIFGNPEWEAEVRASLLASATEECVDYVHAVAMPQISEFLKEDRLITESLIILLLAKMAGAANGLESEMAKDLQHRQLSLATILMMIRVALRVHLDIPLDEAKDEVCQSSTLVKQDTLLGDLINVVWFATLCRLHIPEVVGLTFQCVSDVLAVTFRISEAELAAERAIESSSATTNLRTGQMPAGYPWEYNPTMLSAFCESAMIVCGHDLTLRNRAGLFAHHLGLARYVLRLSHEKEGPCQAKENNLERAMDALSCFPDNQAKALMARLARYYVSAGDVTVSP